MFDDVYFMEKALEQAQKGLENGEVPIGAVVVFNQKIISQSHNLVETLCDSTAHAEIICIGGAGYYLGSRILGAVTLYLTLEPCVMCAGAIYWARPHRVVVAAQDFKNGYRQQKIALHPSTKIEYGLLENKSSDLLIQFFKSKRQNKNLLKLKL